MNKICPDHPVERVSWYDAKEFIRRLNASAGVEGCEGTPQDDPGCYRLPKEAEFELALRAGTKTAYFFGNDSSQLGDYAVYGGNSTHEVDDGFHNPNKLHGMIGNVWEWTEDNYQSELVGGSDPLNRWKSECYHGWEECRVLRGGSWDDSATDLRSASRKRYSANTRFNTVGFRLVRTL